MQNGIYERIERLTAERGISIFELEKRAGVANGSVGKWRGRSPRVDNLMRVAGALDVPIETLLRDDDEQK